jgi:hypothetical protein
MKKTRFAGKKLTLAFTTCLSLALADVLCLVSSEDLAISFFVFFGTFVPY